MRVFHISEVQKSVFKHMRFYTVNCKLAKAHTRLGFKNPFSLRISAIGTVPRANRCIHNMP